MSALKQEIRIGTSGYQYDHWKGAFYPDDLAKSEWFAHYADHFDSVEINNTFYNLPKPQTFAAWRKQSPPGFCYALKFSRYGTHMKKLKSPGEVIGNFMEAATKLEGTLGPILAQLPPKWSANPERLDAFLAAAPSKQRFAVEFRDSSWLCDAVFEVLHRHNAALCVHDMIADHPDEATADWVYYRFHGKDYGGDYSHQKLTATADRLAEHHAAGRDVYAYFNNDLGGHAVHNALDLKRYCLKRVQ